MTYVVTEDCIKCKYMDCVEVCPVDCFYEGDNMLVIHPDECIDCGVCEPECPPKAILPDSDGKAEKWLKMNAEFAVKWPNITRKGTAPADADDAQGRSRTSSRSTSPPNPARANSVSVATWGEASFPHSAAGYCLCSPAAPASTATPCVPGESTVHDVEMVMGGPADKRGGPDGETIYWYPQLPYGHASYAARIAADGRSSPSSSA